MNLHPRNDIETPLWPARCCEKRSYGEVIKRLDKMGCSSWEPGVNYRQTAGRERSETVDYFLQHESTTRVGSREACAASGACPDASEKSRNERFTVSRYNRPHLLRMESVPGPYAISEVYSNSLFISILLCEIKLCVPRQKCSGSRCYSCF